MASVAKPFYRPLCNCCLLPGSHFQDRCARINRGLKAAEKSRAWQERQEQATDKLVAREERQKPWREQHGKKHSDDASTVVGPPRPRLAFTAAETRQLKKVKSELQEIYAIKKQIDAGRKMELALWQWQKVDGKHAQHRLKQLEESEVLRMETAGYQIQICSDFWNTGMCSFGDRCCLRHEREQKADAKKQQEHCADETSTIADTTVCGESLGDDEWAAPAAGDDWQVQVPAKISREEKKAKVYPSVQAAADADVWKPVERKGNPKATKATQKKPIELRLARDGLLYSRDAFVLHYGDRHGETMWDEALQREIQHGSAAFAEKDTEYRLAQEKNALNVESAKQAAANATRARERAERNFEAYVKSLPKEEQRRARELAA